MSERRLVHLGFEPGTGAAVAVPLKHMVVTGQTQEAGKTTTLEAMIARSQVRAVAFITKRGEGTFGNARVIPPYFREQADWQFVASILEASRGEKLKFERAWIIRASKGARTLADVQRNVRKALESAKGLSADVYLTLDAYLDAVVPQIDAVKWAPSVKLAEGVNVMDLTPLNVEMQHLVIRSTVDWVLNHEMDTVVVIPEAWKFIPQGRGTPVKLAAEAYIRQAAGLRNYLWLDSQDIAGVEKLILKSVPVWLLGVQRESNEVKRTLAQIPAGIRKPKLEAIATLGLGEFYVCYGTRINKTYVQPEWMGDDEARAIAMGAQQVTHAPPRTAKKESAVTEKEARELREENERLLGRIETLEFQLRSPEREAERARLREEAVARESAAPLDIGDFETTYQAVKNRLLKELPDHPRLLRVLAERPEIEVTVERKIATVDGLSLRGRVARLIAEGFFDAPVGQSAIVQRLSSTGTRVSTGKHIGQPLDQLIIDGFLTKEASGYKAVPGMKINIVEAR